METPLPARFRWAGNGGFFAALIPLQAPANAPSSASPVYVELGTVILFQCKRAASTVPHQSMEQTTPACVIKVP